MHCEFRRMGDERKGILRETKRAVTPYGGVVVLVELWRRLGLKERVREWLPFRYTSPNQLAPEETWLGFVLGVALGTRRFAHSQWLRRDEALRQACGIARFPSDDTVRNFFRRFGQKEVDGFFLKLNGWLLGQLPGRHCTLDLDSTLFQRHGRQEGAASGYNPQRRGRPTHHPLLAMLAEPGLILHGWLRRGDAAANRGAPEFMAEALRLLPQDWTITGVRADSGFFDGKFLDALEQQPLPYIVVARQHSTLQQAAHAVQAWTRVDQAEVAEFTLQLGRWAKPRRFIAVRKPLPEPGPMLLAVPAYRYRLFVTNRPEAPAWLWHHYDGRAQIEPKFAELKDELGADDFCLQRFFPTEAAVRSVFFTFNLLSILQLCLRPSSPRRRPGTLRAHLFTCGAIAGRAGHTFVLYLSTAWGGLHSRIPLLRILAQTDALTSPKLNFIASG